MEVADSKTGQCKQHTKALLASRPLEDSVGLLQLYNADSHADEVLCLVEVAHVDFIVKLYVARPEQKLACRS